MKLYCRGETVIAQHDDEQNIPANAYGENIDILQIPDGTNLERLGDEPEDGQPDSRPFARPEISLEDAKSSLILDIDNFASFARSSIIGTTDPVKIAEYLDKASSVDAILDGSASAAQIAEATSEAARLGLADAAAVANVWKVKADGLRVARALVNTMVNDAIIAVDQADNIDDLSQLKVVLLTTAHEQLAAMLGG